MLPQRNNFVLPILVVVSCASGLLLLRNGVYGFAVFAAIPILLGASGVALKRPKDAGHAFGIGAITTAAGTAALLLLGTEGLGCIVMALPLVVPLGGIGGVIGWLVLRRSEQKTIARLFL